jgi:RNA polymerase sigma-70 factor, ECF subfamily
MGISQFEQDLVAFLPYLRRFAIHLCKNPSLADDLVQETMLRALSNQDKFEAGTRLEAWLLSICKNYYLSMWRRQMKREAELDEKVIAVTTADLPDPEESLTSIGMLRRLVSLIGSSDLPSVFSDRLFSLLMEGDLTYDEMALVLGVPAGTIKSQISRFRDKARELLGRPDPTPRIRRKTNSIKRPQSWWDSLNKRNKAMAAGRVRAAAERRKLFEQRKSQLCIDL